MINATKMISGKMYSTDFIIAENDNPQVDVCLFSDCNTFEDSIKLFMDMRLRRLKFKAFAFNSIYVPTVISTKIGEVLFRKRTIDVIKPYRRQKSKFKITTFTSDYNSLKNKNVLFDTSIYKEGYLDLTSDAAAVSRKEINTYRTYWRSVIESAVNHKSKVLYFNIGPNSLDEFSGNHITLDKLLRSRNLITLIFYDMQENREEFDKFCKDNNLYLIFSNGSQSIILKPNDTKVNPNMISIQRIIRLCRAMGRCKPGDMVVDEEDVEVVEDMTTKEKDEILKVENSTKKEEEETIKGLGNRPELKDRFSILKEKVNNTINIIPKEKETKIKSISIKVEEPEKIEEEKIKDNKTKVPITQIRYSDIQKEKKEQKLKEKEEKSKLKIESVDDIKIVEEINPEKIKRKLAGASDLPIEEFDDTTHKELEVEVAKNEIINSLDEENLDDIITLLQNKDNDIKEVKEDEVATKVIERLNMNLVRDKLETKEIKNAREKMLKKFKVYDLSVAAEVASKTKLEQKDFGFEVAPKAGFNKSRLINLEKAYKEKLSEVDEMNIFTFPANTSEPMFLTSIKKEDISDRENYMDRVTAIYTDPQGEEHKIVQDIPKILHNGNIFLLGSEKEITKQDAANPVMKCGEDVIITASYNKAFINLKGKYPQRKNVKFIKILDAMRKNKFEPISFMVNTGKYSHIMYLNKYSITLLEINRFVFSITDKNKNISIRFDIDQNENDFTILGEYNGKRILHNPEEDTIWVEGQDKDKLDSQSFLIEILKEIDNDSYTKYEKGITKDMPKDIQRMEITIMGETVPLAYPIIIDIGLVGLLDYLKEHYGLKYKIIEARSDFKLKEDTGIGSIKFKDFAYIIQFNSKLSEALLNPICNLDLTDYDTIDITRIINNEMKNGNYLIYVENFRDLMLDTMTQRVLFSYGLPTQFHEVLIYGGSLLTSYKTSHDVDPRNFRLISNGELINRALYNVMASAYSDYMVKKKRGARAKFFIAPNATMNRLIELNTIAEASMTSPIGEIDQKYAKTMKGISGINSERAYTNVKRVTLPEHIGITTLSTPYNANAGVIKKMSFDPGITNLNGQYEIIDPKDYEKVDGSRVVSFTEALVPYSTFNDSQIRTAMLSSQLNHNRPTIYTDPSLISYGADEAIPYMTEKFVGKSKGNGIVEEVNDNFIKIAYESGEKDVIRLNEIVRDASKGMYFSNNMESTVKPGQKVKPDQILAKSKYFFTDKNKETVLGSGALSWVLLCDGEYVHEDGCLIFSKLSKKLGAPLVKRIDKKFSISTDISFITDKLGQEIDPDEVLLKFNLVGDSDELNSLLSGTDSVLSYEVTSKIKGTLADIRIYYRKSNSIEMSKSCKDTISKIQRVYNIAAGEEILKDDSIDKFKRSVNTNGPIELTSGKFSKINGSTIEPGEILIEFFISFVEEHGIADKLTVSRALKGEVSKVLDSSLAPEGKLTHRKADMLFSSYSVLARKVPGVLMEGYLMAALIERCRRNKLMLGLPIEKDSIMDYVTPYDNKYKK